MGKVLLNPSCSALALRFPHTSPSYLVHEMQFRGGDMRERTASFSTRNWKAYDVLVTRCRQKGGYQTQEVEGGIAERALKQILSDLNAN